MAPSSKLVVGDPAPHFVMPSAEGGEVSLSQLKGKWVVLYFYPRDNTPGCTTEAMEFTELLPEFDRHDAVVLGVSRDSPASHRKFSEKRGLGVGLLSDEETTVMQSYGAWQMKKQCGKECMGTVRSTVLIDPRGKIAHVWPKVTRAAGHAGQVLDTLKAQAG